MPAVTPLQDAKPSPDTGFEATRWIEIERLRLVYRNLPLTVSVSAACACLLAVLLRDAVPPVMLAAWLGVGALVTVVRATHYLQFRRLSDEARDTALWTRRHKLGAAMSGIF